MQKNNGDFWGVSNLSNLKVLINVALFSAISFIFGKFLAIPVGDYIRFSFENLPILLAGILFGPVIGCFTGIAADIVGCILRGYAINPVLTLGAAVIGLCAGAVYRLCYKARGCIKLSITVIASHTLGSVLIKSVGLSIWYHINFGVTVGWRIVNYLIVAAAEFAVIYILMKNKGFKRQILRLTGENNEL